MTPDAMTVLSALLRARPATRDELARAATIPQERFLAAVAELAELGLVAYVDEGGFDVPDVEQPLANLIEAMIGEQVTASESLGHLVRSLPAVARDDRAKVEPGQVPTERVHGTRNQWDLWMRLMDETPPRAPIAVFPDFLGLATVVLENEEMLREVKESLGFTIRTIIVADEISDPYTRPQLAGFAALGIELRTLPSVPGWFYVDEGVLAALPLTWGEAVPTSIAIVREPALLTPLHEYADRLWLRALPLPEAVGADGDPVLDLLAQGLSDGAVARALNLSVRTVRRRIADTAEAYGASSRFALGVEWARRRG